MSQEALMTAVRDTLRSVLSLSAAECEVTFDGSPPPMNGQAFYGVHYGNWTNSGNESLDERYGVNVTVTVKVGAVPWDRIGQELVVKARKGLEALCGKVRLAVVQNENAIVAAADALINADQPNGTVSGCADDGTGHVLVTTAAPHGLATGATVMLVGTGLYESTHHGIAVVSSTTFTLAAAFTNTAAGGAFQALAANGFVEPLRFRDGGRPEPRGGSWFKAKTGNPAGLSQTLTFRDARRVQKVEEAT